MLTTDQTQDLINDGARQVLVKCGGNLVDKASLLECLVYINTVITDAMHNGAHDDITLQSTEREELMQQAAGLMFLTLQKFGVQLYTTHKLKRSLHSTQAPQRALLLENQFIFAEAQEAFHACYDAALNSQPYVTEGWSENWDKLRMALQKLGVKV